MRLILPHHRHVWRPPSVVEPSIEEFKLVDFDDQTVLEDTEWLKQQANGLTTLVVQNKNDQPGGGGSLQAPILTLDPSAGIGGKKCLKVTMDTGSTRLPGFHFFRLRNSNGAAVHPTSNNAWLVLPRVVNLTALRMRCRFDTDYRATKAANPIGTGNERNFVCGTFQSTDAEVNGDFESHNWHHYHYTWLRHDLKNNGWFEVIWTANPSHQRGAAIGHNGGDVGFEPTLYEPNGTPCGTYWSQTTRTYIDAQEYTDSPEIALPLAMYVQDFYALRHTVPAYLSIVPQDYVEGARYDNSFNGSHAQTFTSFVTNISGGSYDAYVTLTGHDKMYTTLTVGGGSTGDGALISWTTGETKTFAFTTTPGGDGWTLSNKTRPTGFNLTPATEVEDGGTSYRNRSNSDANIENRFAKHRGRHDVLGKLKTEVTLRSP